MNQRSALFGALLALCTAPAFATDSPCGPAPTQPCVLDVAYDVLADEPVEAIWFNTFFTHLTDLERDESPHFPSALSTFQMQAAERETPVWTLERLGAPARIEALAGAPQTAAMFRAWLSEHAPDTPARIALDVLHGDVSGANALFDILVHHEWSDVLPHIAAALVITEAIDTIDRINTEIRYVDVPRFISTEDYFADIAAQLDRETVIAPSQPDPDDRAMGLADQIHQAIADGNMDAARPLAIGLIQSGLAERNWHAATAVAALHAEMGDAAGVSHALRPFYRDQPHGDVTRYLTIAELNASGDLAPILADLVHIHAERRADYWPALRHYVRAYLRTGGRDITPFVDTIPEDELDLTLPMIARAQANAGDPDAAMATLALHADLGFDTPTGSGSLSSALMEMDRMTDAIALAESHSDGAALLRIASRLGQ